MFPPVGENSDARDEPVSTTFFPGCHPCCSQNVRMKTITFWAFLTIDKLFSPRYSLCESNRGSIFMLLPNTSLLLVLISLLSILVLILEIENQRLLVGS